MRFPEQPRVIYRRRTLDDVLCQLRFPPILRVDAEPPSAFQDSIRGEYPLYEEVQPDLPGQLPDPLAQLLRDKLRPRVPKEHNFKTVDEKWTIALNRDFLGLSTVDYVRWEQFRSRLQGPFDALMDVYKPAFFSRVGLRYVNAIVRSRLGLDNVAWSQLLEPRIAGELMIDEMLPDVETARRELVVALPGGAAHVRHGLAQLQGTSEQIYLIDADFYTKERTEGLHAFNILGNFNLQARRLFRWCVGERLHEAMQPEAIE